MKKKVWNGGLLLFPVKRKLCVCTIFYLTGIVSALFFSPEPWISGILAAAFLIAQVWMVHTRRSAVVGLSLLLLIAGNFRMGYLLRSADQPTESGVNVSGTVVRRIKGQFRVQLSEVTVNDVPLRNDVAVTLMIPEDGEEPEPPEEGQFVSGSGKLFAPDEVRNPGGSDWEPINFSNGYDLSGYLLDGWTVEKTERFSLQYWQRTIHEGWTALIDRVFGDEAPFFRALIGGDKSAIDDDTILAMRKTGIVHILTISGLHISLITEMIVLLLKKLGIRKKKKNALLILILGAYSFVIGYSVGTVRALIMGALKEYARDRNERYDSVTAVSFAALLMTMVNPALVFNWSFQFSFYIVLGLGLIENGISGMLRNVRFLNVLPEFIFESFVFCAAAQIAALPIQLNAYGYFSLASLPLNFLVGFLMPVLIAGGFFTLLAGSVSAFLAAPFVLIMGMLAGTVENASLYLSSIDEALCRLPEPGWPILILVLFCFALWGGKIQFGKMERKTLAASSVCVLILYALHFNPAARYVQLDVGQGDAAVFRYGRHAVLYDVGPGNSYDVLNYLRHEGLLVDGIILSHLDDDHAGALEKLAESEIVPDCIISAEKDAEGTDSEPARNGWNYFLNRGTKFLTASAGDTVAVGKLIFNVLSPAEEAVGDNERSLVLFTEWEGTKFLLTGDLPSSCEPAGIPDTDVLKVAHHGSKNSTSPEFLAACTPAYALISVGAYNYYGHPSERVLDDLADVGAEILRTDRRGCITLWLCPGKMLRTDTFFEEQEDTGDAGN